MALQLIRRLRNGFFVGLNTFEKNLFIFEQFRINGSANKKHNSLLKINQSMKNGTKQVSFIDVYICHVNPRVIRLALSVNQRLNRLRSTPKMFSEILKYLTESYRLTHSFEYLFLFFSSLLLVVKIEGPRAIINQEFAICIWNLNFHVLSLTVAWTDFKFFIIERVKTKKQQSTRVDIIFDDLFVSTKLKN